MTNYCTIPGASKPYGMWFDTENSRCIPAERMTPDEFAEYRVCKSSECENWIRNIWGK